MSKSRKELDAYRKARDFRKTPEPRGAGSRSKPSRRFVIQLHDASTLHYDFRLEVGGVLKSWAVPKGPSTDPREKRLAIATEDHPLEYAEFEGVIPEGEYGAGKVLVWDTGTYRSLSRDPGESGSGETMKSAIEDGHVSFWLDGKKLQGGFALTRIRKGRDKGSSEWLLVKMDDEKADARRNPTSTEPASVLSGRELSDLESNDS